MSTAVNNQVVELSVAMAASAEEVWRVLTEPARIAAWMLGAQVSSSWQAGSNIAYTLKMPGLNKLYHDRGTVLVAEHGKVLKYSYWSEAEGLPDNPENRSVITFQLEAHGEGTRLLLLHEYFRSEAAYKHAVFFWSYALGDIKKLLEA